jgi:hypothetical protein
VPSEHHEVGVQPDALDASDAEEREVNVVLEVPALRPTAERWR